MKLLSKEIISNLPSIATVEDQPIEEQVALLKFSLPGWKWFVFGGNQLGHDYLFYGKVFSPYCPEGELGDFTLSQLESVVEVKHDKKFNPLFATQLV